MALGGLDSPGQLGYEWQAVHGEDGTMKQQVSHGVLLLLLATVAAGPARAADLHHHRHLTQGVGGAAQAGVEGADARLQAV